MRQLFAIAVLMLSFSFAQAQENQPIPGDPSAARASTTIAVEKLVGKFGGSYDGPRARSYGASLKILSAQDNAVEAEYWLASSPILSAACSGTLPAKGLMSGQVLNMTVAPAAASGCTELQIRLTVSEDGKRLEGEITGSGVTTVKIRFSR